MFPQIHHSHSADATQDYRTTGLYDYRTIGLQDYKTIGL